VQPVGSVAAFVARYGAGAAADPAAAEILDTLDAEARLVVDAQAQPLAERRAWLSARSGTAWAEARLSHVEERAFVQLRRELQRRGFWQP
jgi:hypothetical protein